MPDQTHSTTFTLALPFPTPRLAGIAHSALSIDAELSPLVSRSITLDNATLQVHYAATTNRMLRVALNGFFESLGVVLGVMREMDVDVANEAWIGDEVGSVDERERLQGLDRVQGVGEGGVL